MTDDRTPTPRRCDHMHAPGSCTECSSLVAALRSERDALATALRDMIDLAIWMSGSGDFGPGGLAEVGWRDGRNRIGMAQKALASSPRPSPGGWYEADGSAILLPGEEVERRRKAAAKVIDAARRVMEDLDNLHDVRARTGLDLGRALDELDRAPAPNCPASVTGNPIDCGGCPEHAAPAPERSETPAPDHKENDHE
jgi:hypothetical protein